MDECIKPYPLVLSAPYRNKYSSDDGSLAYRVLSVSPGVRQHFCYESYPGSFIEQLYDGLPISHVIQHLFVEAAVINHIPVLFLDLEELDDNIHISMRVPLGSDADILHELMESWFRHILS